MIILLTFIGDKYLLTFFYIFISEDYHSRSYADSLSVVFASMVEHAYFFIETGAFASGLDLEEIFELG